ncbi:urea ABC transporter substrate-binding protein (plasmid) [Tundrisphaera lichenicola]|uniref:urea ABC transporter substrate-binding protein n=1 Tax=Tundrisphaera lichenicola TaxID=2029860 RepID=UPI003EB9A10F
MIGYIGCGKVENFDRRLRCRTSKGRAMRRWWLLGLGLLVAAIAAGFVVAQEMGARPLLAMERLLAGSQPPIVVGLLHSRTGALAISEKSLIDAETLAIEEINARGGIAGRRVEARVADGRSDVSAFVAEARRLIDNEKVSVLFGTYTAEVRRAVLSVVEERRGILFVPGNFEGMERSPRIIYAGGSANQSVIPAVRWAVETLKARRFFVVGSEEIWSRSVAEFAKDSLKANGVELVGESYLPMGGLDAKEAVEAIKASKPDLVLSSILGDSNEPFYVALRDAGLTPEKLPVLSYSIAEDELRMIAPGTVAGHYSAWNYFQSVDRAENRDFVARFKARFGQERVTSDAIVSAYNAVSLWAQSVEELGTADPDLVLQQLRRQSLDAPDAIVTLDPESHAFWRQFHIGRARLDGQFDVVWSISKAIRPLTYLGTRSKQDWFAMPERFRATWGGRWSSSSSKPPAPATGPAGGVPDPSPR